MDAVSQAAPRIETTKYLYQLTKSAGVQSFSVIILAQHCPVYDIYPYSHWQVLCIQE